MKNIKKNLVIIILGLSLALGTFLRFYDLGKTPNSLDWDEVSWGYNAYSVLKTGQDEHGSFLPLSFKAFGDYKQPVYVYVDVLPVALFDLNGFATRFPSAFLGSFSILFVFLLVLELFSKNKDNKKIAAISTFLFAISPWSIQFSRVAFEANVGLFFVVLGAWLFLKGLNNKKILYLFAALIPIAVSAYTYHSEKLFAPIVFLILLFYGFKFFNLKRSIVIALCLLFFALNLPWLVDSRTTERGRGVMFLSSPIEILETSFRDRMYAKSQNAPLAELVQAPKVLFAERYLQNYMSHFDLNWLFFKGDSPRHHAPGFGLLYLVELPFILLGIFYLLKNKNREGFLLFSWFLAAPLASALAIDAPNASRSEIFLPIWQIFSAVGILYAFNLLKNKKIFYLGAIFFVLAFSFNFLRYIHQNFVQTNASAQKDWQYGYKEAIEYALLNTSANQKIFFAEDFEQPYIFYLFHTKYDPAQYIKEGATARISKSCYTIDKAYFGSCMDRFKAGDIFMSVKAQFGPRLKEINKIRYVFGDTAVHIYRVID